MKIGNAINFWFVIKYNIKYKNVFIFRYNVMYSHKHIIIYYERISGIKHSLFFRDRKAFKMLLCSPFMFRIIFLKTITLKFLVINILLNDYKLFKYKR
jgi:hypothetical protein